VAKELRLVMCPEVHTPSNLKGKMVTDYVGFIKEAGTKHFGLNIGFSVFRSRFGEGEWKDPKFRPNTPEDKEALVRNLFQGKLHPGRRARRLGFSMPSARSSRLK